MRRSAGLATCGRQGPYAAGEVPVSDSERLNLPRDDAGGKCSRTSKTMSGLRLPVWVLTTSETNRDIARAYSQHAMLITKPVAWSNSCEVIQAIENFWLTLVRLPPKGAEVSAEEPQHTSGGGQSRGRPPLQGGLKRAYATKFVLLTAPRWHIALERLPSAQLDVIRG